jgi:hypothetical protein
VIGGATFAWFLLSRLAFSPVPWPDASAFYLPGLDLIHWPPHWRMHAQAAFVPSYDQANFNTMPLLPALLGIVARSGITRWLGASVATRAVSLLALLGAAGVVWSRGRRELGRSSSAAWATLAAGVLALTFLFYPVLRWGTQVVRTESWIGLLGLLMLFELARLARVERSDRSARSRSLWTLALLLALGAYFHFEAIVLVPAAVVGLWPWGMEKGSPAGEWFSRCFQVGARTVLLLSPWLLYVALHFGLFREQMDTQFFRLAHGNSLLRDAYGIFHSLFISHGSAVSWPKFFNVGKGLFWLAIAVLLNRTTLIFFVRGFKASGARDPEVTATIAPTLAAFVYFATTMALWFRKPEVWFITLCHFALLSWAVFQLAFEAAFWKAAKRPYPAAPRARDGLLTLVGAYGVLAFLATVGQFVQIPTEYSWKTYDRWIDCIDRTITLSMPPELHDHPLKIWQPHVPDALVELSARHPNADLTRALDFPEEEDLAWALAQSSDVILFSRHYPVPLQNGEVPVYEGPERPLDQAHLQDKVEVPFGTWGLDRLDQAQPGEWKRQVCQIGPFWGDIAFRVKRHPASPKPASAKLRTL